MSKELNDQNTTTTTLAGGAIRLTIGSQKADTAPQAPYESSRVHSGVTRFSMAEGGEVTQAGVTRYSAGQDRPVGSISATLQRDHNGESVELVPGVPGSRTKIATALRDGLIERGFDGSYRDKGTAGQDGPAGAPGAVAGGVAGPEGLEDAPQVDPGLGVFSAEEDADWAADIEPLPQFAYDNAAALASVGNFDGAARRLVEGAGIEPTLAAEYVNEGYNMFERVVSKVVIDAGVQDKQAFYAWVRESKGRALQQAIGALTATRDVSHFRTLAAEFNRHNK